MVLNTEENSQNDDGTYSGVAQESRLFRKRSNTFCSIRRRNYNESEATRRNSALAKLERERTNFEESKLLFNGLQKSLSGTSTTQSKLFLMGGIVTTPMMPTRRRTSIPLTMHASDYEAMVQAREQKRLNSVSSQRSIAESPNYLGHVCPYINGAEFCRKCIEIRKREIFVDKVGKLYMIYEYQEEVNKIKVVVSQYGNMQIEGHSFHRKPNVSISVKVIFDGYKKMMTKKLDWCRGTNDFKFNYLFHFDCKTIEMARKAHLTVNVKYKKALFMRRKMLNKFSANLNNIEIDPEVPEEHQLKCDLRKPDF